MTYVNKVLGGMPVIEVICYLLLLLIKKQSILFSKLPIDVSFTEVSYVHDFENVNDVGEVCILSFSIRFMPQSYFGFTCLSIKVPQQVEKLLNLESKYLSSGSTSATSVILDK